MSGTENIQEIELVDGRGHPGQSWILRFNNIDTVEQVCAELGCYLSMIIKADTSTVML